ncbi:MAG: molybdenum cofactor guanylyltransferase [Chloroflexi bacterium]|nr:molybdenum cofactor guanylyltransferase [Chloroflexota bacterium]
MASIVLAGGRSTRLGRDKVSLVIGGEGLLQRTINHLKRLNQEIILVLAQGQPLSKLDSSTDVRLAMDVELGKGPLVGVYSGLKASNDDYNVVVACDMPFLNVELMRYMIGLGPGFDIVIPRIGDKVEPLHAVYSKSCLDIIEGMMSEGNLKVSNLLELANARFVEGDELDKFDPDHQSWFNINMPADLKKAEEILNRERSK